MYAPNREQTTCDKIKKLVPKELLEYAFVPKREIVVKMKGEWVTYVKPLYRDYFFVATRDVSELDKVLSKLSFPARIAKGEGNYYAPIAKEAQEFLEQVMDGAHTIRTSTGIIVDDELQIQRGPLVGMEHRVIKVMRQKSSCLVTVSEGGKGFQMVLPLAVPLRL